MSLDDEVPDDEPEQPAPPKRRSGSIVGSMMMGLHAIYHGPKKDDIVVEVETSGDPPNLDTDGIDDLVDGHRVTSPPLERISPRATVKRRKKRRR
jgi:hypothetical protein